MARVRGVIRLALVLVLVGVGTGCTWINSYLTGEANTLPPAELTDIDRPVPIRGLWATDAGDGNEDAFLDLTPIASADTVYTVGHDGQVTALDADSGAVRWRRETGLPISAGPGLAPGLVLIGTIEGRVVALDSDSGEERWRAQVSSEVLAPPRAAQGLVVVRSIDGGFFGLDADDGSQRWRFNASVPVLSLRGSAAPLLGQGVAIAGLDNGKLLVLRLDNGVPVFEATISQPQGRTEVERLVDIDSTPVVVGTVLFAVAYQGDVAAIDLQTGNTGWSRPLSSHAGLDADRRHVYVVDDEDTVWALDSGTGEPRWRQSALRGRRLSAPVIHGDYVVVGDFEGYLHWLDRDDGRLAGRVQVDGDGISGHPLVYQGRLYALGADGRLGAYQVADQ